MFRSGFKKPEISRAILKCKTPIYYSPEENIRNIKTPIHLSSGRWSPIKIRSYKNLKIHEVILAYLNLKAIFIFFRFIDNLKANLLIFHFMIL